MSSLHTVPQLTTRFGVKDDDAWKYTSVIPLSSIVLSPILGIMVDRFGKMIWMCGLGFCLLSGALVLLLSRAALPGLAFGIIGLAFSIEPAAVWVCVPILAKPGASDCSHYFFSLCPSMLCLPRRSARALQSIALWRLAF